MATRHLMINRRGEKLDVKKYFDWSIKTRKL
jgi:hypothetical protein